MIKEEESLLQTVKMGEYEVTDVPTIILNKPTPTGEMTIREASVDLKLSRIYQEMKKTKQYKVSYNDFN
jgi:hypothetical protein